MADDATIRGWLPRRRRGNTALHFAAMDGDSAMVEKLISAGAEVDAANKNGCGWGQLCGFGDRGDGGALAQRFFVLLWIFVRFLQSL